jgi:hypothetical protein
MMACRRTVMARKKSRRRHGPEIEELLGRHGVVYKKEVGKYVKLPEPVTLLRRGGDPSHLTPEWQVAEQLFKDLDPEFLGPAYYAHSP